MIIIAILISTLLAGFIQGVSGFGAGIVFMSVIPYFLSVISSAVISNFMSVFLNLLMTYHYRQAINKTIIVLPALFFYYRWYFVTLFCYDDRYSFFKINFRSFLTILAIYFYFFSHRVKITNNIFTMFLCGFVSGVCDGLFGIGGPLMVLFFLALTNSKDEYLGTISLFFLIVCSYNLIFRIVHGIFTLQLLPYALLSLIMVFVGLQLGNRVVCKIDEQRLRKITYILIGFSGIITLLTAI